MTLTAVAACALAPPARAGAAELPLGPPSLPETRATTDLRPGVTLTRIARGRPGRGTGPWRVNVIEAAPGTPAGARLSNGVIAGVARPSVFGRRELAGVNGAYFAGDGDVVGAHVSGGELASEPVDGRSALILSSDELSRPRVAALAFAGAVRAGGRERLLDGVNRRRGVVWGCGGRGGDRPTQRPRHGVACTDPSELVQFTRGYGARTPRSAGGVEVAVRRGRVAGPARSRGRTPIPRDGYVLSGSGDAAVFLRRARGEVDTSTGLRAAGRPLLVGDLAGVVSGGPRLVAGGRVVLRRSVRAEGFDRPGLHGRFVAAPHPRTLAGVTRSGALLLVTVDGRRPGWSAGVTLAQAARLMQALGAHDALNLDGGGSTAMVVRGRVVSRPSDPGGERAVGDGVFVRP